MGQWLLHLFAPQWLAPTTLQRRAVAVSCPHCGMPLAGRS
jgi:hypothetical protein